MRNPTTARKCRTTACGGAASYRSGLCRPCVLRRRYYGHAETRAPAKRAQLLHVKQARRLLAHYGNRKATTEALRLAGMVPDYRPPNEFTNYLRAAYELERLGARASAEEILERAVAAYIGITSDVYTWPDARSYWQHVGRMVLGELWHRDPEGRRYLLTGRVVAEIGEHVNTLLGPYCRTLLSRAKAEKDSIDAAVERSCDFED